MACGNNKISRGYLTSPPVSTKSQADSVFAYPRAETVRVNGEERKAYYSSGKWAPMQGSRPASVKTVYFLDENGRMTFDPDFHVTVIHGDREVNMHVTDRRPGMEFRYYADPLVRPSGNQVNAAEARLVSILRSRKR